MRAGFDTFSGYGNDGVDIARYLERAGVDVTPWPTGCMPGLPREFTRLLEKHPTGKHDIVLAFAPPFDLNPSEYAHLADHAVAYTMWETSRFPREALRGRHWNLRRRDVFSGGHQLGKRRDGIDRLLVTCAMNVDAFRNVDRKVPIQVLPCGIDSDAWPMQRRDPSRQLTFGMIGMLAGRKDPWLAIQAWQELKEEHPEFDARFEFKTSCAGLHPAIEQWLPDVKIHDRIWSKQQVLDWYYGVDVLVSTSRGEGNNKPAMEFMATGGTVIASDWSGHQNWLYPEATYPLPGALMPVHPSMPDTLDFRGDKAALKDLMLRCWKERAEVVRKGEVAAGVIRAAFAWPVIANRLTRILSAVCES